MYSFYIDNGLLLLKDEKEREILIIGNKKLGLSELPEDSRVVQISSSSAVLYIGSLGKVFYLSVCLEEGGRRIDVVGYDAELLGKKAIPTSEGVFFIGEKDYLFVGKEVFSGPLPPKDSRNVVAVRDCLIAVSPREIWVVRNSKRSIIIAETSLGSPTITYTVEGDTILFDVKADNERVAIKVDVEGGVVYGREVS